VATDTSERGLETLIVSDMTAADWIAGEPSDYDREHALDLAQLRAFLLTKAFISSLTLWS
jgi:type I restriction enzyme, R subunit